VKRLAVLLVLASLAGGSSVYAATFPARVQAKSDEYSIVLSRQKVPAGLVKIEHVNFGEDPHDLRLRRIGGTHTYVFAKIAAGGREVRTFRLRAGSYHVWCAVSGHRAKGMHAMLRVTR
jgi:hypothetical protein